MTDLSEMRAAALEILGELGTTCTIASSNAVYANGAVTGASTDVTATCSDLQDESRRYAATDTTETVSGTFYIAASGLTVTPKVDDHVVYLTRTFLVVNVTPYSLQGGVAAYRLDVAEMGSA